MRTCTKCGESKPLSFFYRHPKGGPSGTFNICIPCKKAYEQRRYRENADRKRRAAADHSLKYRYGITPEQYDNLFRQQGGLCAICRSPGGNGPRRWSFRPLHVDHDHQTGRIRGLLCFRCNSMLGNARDDLEVLRSAVAYLEGEPACQQASYALRVFESSGPS